MPRNISFDRVSSPASAWALDAWYGFGCLGENQAEFLSYYTIATSVALPMAIVAVCNSGILWFVRRSSLQVHAEAARKNGSHGRELQLMKTQIGTFTILMIGWTLAFIFQTLLQNLTLPIALSICIRTLPSVSMVLDVSLLIYTNQPVRLDLKQRILRQAAPGNPPQTNRNRSSRLSLEINLFYRVSVCRSALELYHSFQG